jgi:hypothetical protein
VKLEKIEVQQSLNSLHRYEETLLSQISNLKDSLFQKGKALKDHVSDAPDALKFQAGDVLWIYPQGPDSKGEVWRGENTSTRQVGSFPRDLVVLLKEEDLPGPTGRKRSKSFMFPKSAPSQRSSPDVFKNAREALEGVNRSEKLTRLSKFFGTTTDDLEQQVKTKTKKEK